MGVEEPMKRFAWMLMVLIPGLLFAQDRTRTFVDQVEGGSLTLTNYSKSAAYELKHISFSVPAAWTNDSTFSISQRVRYKLPDAQTTIITTNTGITAGIIGAIETNTYRYAQGYVDSTNTWTGVATNTTATQYFDTDDFPKGWSWEWNDIQVFSFTATNKITLIRVYDVYPRP